MDASHGNGMWGKKPTPAQTGNAVAGGSTIELSYTDEELAFLKAIDLYKRRNRRPFPTWHEVLAVVKALGYRKVAPACEPGSDSGTSMENPAAS